MQEQAQQIKTKILIMDKNIQDGIMFTLVTQENKNWLMQELNLLETEKKKLNSLTHGNTYQTNSHSMQEKINTTQHIVVKWLMLD
jgi:hypothetical protein